MKFKGCMREQPEYKEEYNKEVIRLRKIQAKKDAKEEFNQPHIIIRCINRFIKEVKGVLK